VGCIYFSLKKYKTDPENSNSNNKDFKTLISTGKIFPKIEE
jgi:hypothetical protein